MIARAPIQAACALAVLFAGAGPAQAIRGGAVPSASDRLARATVGVRSFVDRGRAIGVSYCSGVLVASNEVLTAGHCVSGNPIAAVVLASSGKSGRLTRYSVSRIDRYATDLGNVPGPFVGSLSDLTFDTALLRLSAPVPGTAGIRIGSSAKGVASRLRLDGRGYTGTSVGALRTTVLAPIARTDTGIIVAKSISAPVCRGDSGSPVVEGGASAPVLLGVASAVLTVDGTCGSIVIIAPARP